MGLRAAGSRGQNTSSFLLKLPASAYVSLHLLPASSKAVSLICSVPQNGSDPQQLASVVFPSSVAPSRLLLWLLVGTKATVMATGL